VQTKLLRISHSFGLKLVMAMTKSNRRFRTYNSDLGKITIDYDTFVSFDSKDINKEKNMTMLRINERSKVMDD